MVGSNFTPDCLMVPLPDIEVFTPESRRTPTETVYFGFLINSSVSK